MKSRHRKVAGRGTHATSAKLDDYEDASAVDHLTEKLYDKMQLVQDRKEASRQEAKLLKVVNSSSLQSIDHANRHNSQ